MRYKVIWWCLSFSKISNKLVAAHTVLLVWDCAPCQDDYKHSLECLVEERCIFDDEIDICFEEKCADDISGVDVCATLNDCTMIGDEMEESTV